MDSLFCPPVDEGRYRGTGNLDLLYAPQLKEQAAPGEESQALLTQQRFVPLEVQNLFGYPYGWELLSTLFS